MTVGDLCDTISDTYHGEGEKVVLINTSDVLEGKVLNRQAVVNKNLKGQFKKTFKRNDILYSEIRPANKRYAFVDFEDTENYIASTKLMVLRSREDIVRPRFLLSFLSSKSVLKELQQLAETRSGTFPQITFSSELAPIPINIPDLETQDRIVEILDVLERKISTNTEINKNLEQQAKTIFKSWFINYDPFGHQKPNNWLVSTLGNISIMGAGGDKPQNVSPIKTDLYQYPIYSNGLSDEGLYGFTDKPKISEESVTVSARGTIGSVCLRHIPYVPIVRLVTLIPKTEIISAKYLYLWLKQLHITGTGTTQQQLTVPNFQKTEILIPSQDIVTIFTNTVEPIFEKIWENQSENEKLSSLRDTLLPKLMSGEIDVSRLKL